MVKIEIDDVYRKPSNFFQLKIVSIGKIFKVPYDAYGSYDRGFSIYDKETGGTLACSDFGRKWEEAKLTHSVLKSFIQKRFSLALQSNGYVSHKKNKLHNSYVAYSSSKEIQIADRDICKFFDGFEYRIISLEDVYYVCINPHLKIKTEASIKDMIAKGLSPERLSNLPAEYIGSDGRNKRCNIIGLRNGKCLLRDLDEGQDLEIDSNLVHIIPKPDILQDLFSVMKNRTSIIDIQRQYSFLSQKEAAKGRFSKTLEIASILAEQIFPLKFSDFEIQFVPKTVSMRM